MNHWDVLNDTKILEKAQREFGFTSINAFYSNPDVTLRKGGIFFISQNPGGDPRSIPSQLREKPLDHPQRAATRVDWCKYLDEQWGTANQKNVEAFAATALPGGAAELRTGFCSSALLVRGKLGMAVDVDGVWNLARPWHLAWLREARPRAVICIGNGENRSAFAWYRALLQKPEESKVVPTYSTFSVKVTAGSFEGYRVTLVGLPNLARWSPATKRSTAAMRLVAATLRSVLDRR